MDTRGDRDNSGETRKGARDGKGRFGRGNRAALGNGGGRPPRATEEAYLAALLGAVSLDDWRAATLALLARAKDGDPKAFQLLAAYLAPVEARSRVAVETVPEVKKWSTAEVWAKYESAIKDATATATAIASRIALQDAAGNGVNGK